MTRDEMKVIRVPLKNLLDGTVEFADGWRVVGTISTPNAISYIAGKPRGDVYVTLVKTEEVE